MRTSLPWIPRSKRPKGRWEKAACLGDLVGYGPQPNEVIERVRSLGAVTIRGNHDKAVSGLVDAEDFNPLAAQRHHLDARATSSRKSANICKICRKAL